MNGNNFTPPASPEERSLLEEGCLRLREAMESGAAGESERIRDATLKLELEKQDLSYQIEQFKKDYDLILRDLNEKTRTKTQADERIRVLEETQRKMSEELHDVYNVL
ncbi:hypothetical protein N7495_007739 [Penicillium taxi]|uniref:uncharacterized protein n=1 Tax=Penicillium taxi TaxID=168475 RepID=UPI0025454CB3|nr:uncharacterized protein N7495_007739 [Penicillium taxi]KAJ5887698.1 hypothetical protein N7495_007739 [Penicillium taxi]